MDNPATEFVTYRELIAMLDTRDVRQTAQILDLSRKMEHLDDHGSRGLQRVSDQLAVVVAELRRHAEDHATADKQGISSRQWTLTTSIALAGALLTLWDRLPT